MAKRGARIRGLGDRARLRGGGVFERVRLLTLEDTIEFFNMVLGTQLTAAEKSDLLAFLYVL